MKSDDKWVWGFLGYRSELGETPVQDWYDALSDDAKLEVIGLVRYLSDKTSQRWQKPSFDPLRGSCGISELRPDPVVVETEQEIEYVTYRIYGFFGPGDRVYTFLHGDRKDVKNDRRGKQIACERLREFQLNRATAERFRFSEKPIRQVVEEPKYQG